MADGIKKMWNDLPPIAKTVVVIAAALGTYALYKKIKNDGGFGKTGTVDNRQYLKDIDEERKRIEASGIKPTLTRTQVSDVANALYHSMSGYNIFNQEDAHIPNFRAAFERIKNIADLYAVIDSFKLMKGSNLNDWIIREYASPCAGGGFTSVFYAEMCLPKTIANNHLKKYGIDYKF